MHIAAVIMHKSPNFVQMSGSLFLYTQVPGSWLLEKISVSNLFIMFCDAED